MFYFAAVLPGGVDMAREVLIVEDMLRGFLEEGYPLYCGPAARQIIPKVKTLLEERDWVKVLFLCDTHDPDDLEFRMFPKHCVEGTPESEVIPELAGYPGLRIPKKRFDPFYNTKLEGVLAELAPDKVTVVGVCTDICVLYAVAGLRNRNYEVEVPGGAVASFDEEAHNWGLRHMDKALGAKIV